MRTRLVLLAVLILLLISTVVTLSSSLAEQVNTGVPRQSPEVVIIPTLRNDHQFNLDYTVAHLMALLNAIGPDAILVDDYTDWLRRECPWNTFYPEIHVALGYARERSLALFGTRTTPERTFEEDAKVAEKYGKTHPDVRAVEGAARRTLDARAARIARDYSFPGESRDLHVLVTRIFPSKRKEGDPREHAFHMRESKRIATEIERLLTRNSSHRRWAVLLRWEQALLVEDALRAQKPAQVVAVTDYLPLKAAAVEKQMDYKHTAWILAGVLDEWYGMWAPQVFPRERIAALLVRLKRHAPREPAAAFLEARWLMQHRDYGQAEPILKRLVESAGDAKFPFPVNGKWIRPPWSSVRDKARLNLAFVYDYKGEREKALELYRVLLDKGDRLNDEARAVGYIYDDIRAVVESYTKSPYTGIPEEAIRHFPIIARKPEGACKDR
ncbi:MAG: hypothetical protein WD894_19100 [Pirellulales bacterium]